MVAGLKRAIESTSRLGFKGDRKVRLSERFSLEAYVDGAVDLASQPWQNKCIDPGTSFKCVLAANVTGMSAATLQHPTPVELEVRQVGRRAARRGANTSRRNYPESVRGPCTSGGDKFHQGASDLK